MKEIIGAIGLVVGAVLLGVGLSAILALFISWGLAFAFGVSIGFLKVWVGMFVVKFISRYVFSGVRSLNFNTKEAK